MKLHDIEKRVNDVLARVPNDIEAAHAMDDALRAEFLQWLADGAWLAPGMYASADYIGRCAVRLLLTADMPRWYA